MEQNKIYFCDACYYKTHRITDYRRHLSSSKHANRNIITSNKKEKQFECDCGKLYSHMSGLSRHRPICSIYLSKMFDNENVKKIDENEKIKLTNGEIEKIENSDGEIKLLLTDIAKHLKELKEIKPITSSTHYNNSYVLNLNMFLNENCKNAISLQDFVKQITFVFDDLKDRKWRSKILLNNLGSLELENRPFHCVDSNTCQVVLKNGSVWQEGSTDDIVSTLDLACLNDVDVSFSTPACVSWWSV
jgi:hypothetical protein